MARQVRRHLGQTYTPCDGTGQEPAKITSPERTLPSPTGPVVRRAKGACPVCKRIGISVDATGQVLVRHAPRPPKSGWR